jgi:hypothetical protein
VLEGLKICSLSSVKIHSGSMKFYLAFGLMLITNEWLEFGIRNIAGREIIDISQIRAHKLLFISKQLQTWRLHEIFRLYLPNLK